MVAAPAAAPITATRSAVLILEAASSRGPVNGWKLRVSFTGVSRAAMWVRGTDSQPRTYRNWFADAIQLQYNIYYFADISADCPSPSLFGNIL